jgi:tetratricopeptide (TPR) repeat protein
MFRLIIFFSLFTTVLSFSQNQSIIKEEGSNDSVFLNYKYQLENSYKLKRPSLIVENHFKLGKYFHNSGIYSAAVEQYNLALYNLDNQSKDTLEIVLKNHLGEIYLSINNNVKAREYLKESKLLAEDLGYKKGIAIAEAIIGTSYEKEGNYLKALFHQEKSLKIFQDLNDKEGIAKVNENLGSIYEDLGEYKNAYNYFKKSFDYFNEVNSTKRINVLNNIGDIYRKTGNYKEALIHTNLALNLAESHSEMHQMMSAHKDLSIVYSLMENYENAHKHLKEFDEIRKELDYSQNIRQLNVLQTLYDTNQKKAQIALLNEQNAVNKANQTLLIVGISAILLLFGISYFHFNRKRKEKIKLQYFERQLLQSKLDKKAIEEKKLHDEIHLKTASLSKYSLNIAQKNKMIADLSGTLTKISTRTNMDIKTKIGQLVKELDTNLQKDEEWDEFMNFFKEIHPDFIKNLSSTSTFVLTSAELRLAMLLRLNLSSKEIAAILRVTPDSVRVARYRLRKKIPIKTKQELVNFMLEL